MDENEDGEKTDLVEIRKSAKKSSAEESEEKSSRFLNT